MVITTNKRLTINVSPENWMKYCDLKTQHLRDHGTPELSFSEYADLSMSMANPTLDDLISHRKQRKRNENSN